MQVKAYISFLDNQGVDYVWQFTKQDGSFENAFNATKLLADWLYFSDQKVSLEEAFAERRERYNIANNYRTLIISQFYGLLTKKASSYKDEIPTPIYTNLLTCTTIKEYVSLLTEQLLKIKLPPIIHSKGESFEDRHIFPVIFTYQVLKKLKDNSINGISLDKFYTYIATSNYHNDVESVVSMIIESGDEDIAPQVEDYRGRSRILRVFKNIDLFNIDSSISINSNYEDLLDIFLTSPNANFIFDDKLKDDNNYKKFLYENQNFNIILKDYIDQDINTQGESLEDEKYSVEVNNVDVSQEEEEELQNNCNKKPEFSSSQQTVPKRNSKLGKHVLKKATFKCEYNETHETFISKSSHKQYMEAHHLIPIPQQAKIWESNRINIDCLENIVSVCPICHRAMHYGIPEMKEKILTLLLKKREICLKKIGLDIEINKIMKYYL